MKYIRTKSNDIVSLFYNEKEWENLSPSQTAGLPYNVWFEIVTNNLDILKSGDSIEELCDMFVVELNGKMPVEMPLSEKEQYEKMKKIVSEGMKLGIAISLKLAIWTDKGLIYKAKMNEKGEFELIW